MKSPIYARDLAEHLRTDGFMGEGFEEMLLKADAEGKEVIVGHFMHDPIIEG